MRRKRWWYIAAPFAPVLLALLAFRSHFLSRGVAQPPARPAYGGGAIWVWPDNGSPVLLRPEPDGAWTTRAATEWHPESSINIQRPYRTLAGDLARFRMGLDTRQAPYIIRVRPAGEQVLVRSAGDDNLHGISPDDRNLLYLSEDLKAPK